jgi:hypothetical protein
VVEAHRFPRRPASPTPSSFATGTKLHTNRGWLPIEELRVGDEVWSKPEGEPGHPGGWKLVEELFQRTGRIWHLHVGGQLIRTTGEHPFYVVGKGWTDACFLQPGDLLCSRDGSTIAVEEAYDTGEYETVYNCRVADWHTYFVGCDEWGFDVWAHNACVGINPVTDGYSTAAPMANRLGVLLRNRALTHRIVHNVSPGRNVAVVLYRRDGKLYTRAFVSQGAGPNSHHSTHPETIGLRQLRREGISSRDIVAVYTDRAPCRGCNIELRRFGLTDRNTQVFWGVRSGANSAEQVTAIQQAVTAATTASGGRPGALRFPLSDSAVRDWAMTLLP